ncbi:hypothetical protein LSH36_344g04064, partial [Paralvinella palmiformis]
NSCGLVYDILYQSQHGEGILQYRGYPGKFKYLTFWCEIIQTSFFGISLINSLVGSNLSPKESPDKRNSLQKIRDIFAAVIVFPIGSFVVLTFWILYAIDRELVFPKELDDLIPPWLNHVMSFSGCDLCFEGTMDHKGSRGIYRILWIAFSADLWVYPVLKVLSWPGRIGFLAGCWFILIVLYLIGEKFTALVWQPEEISRKKGK